MDFGWSEPQVAFRERLSTAIDGLLPPDWATVSCGYDNGSEAAVAFSRTFCTALAEQGLLVPHWPTADGGGGLDAFHHWMLNEETWARGEPRAYQYMSVNWVGPAILKFGSDAQKAFHLPRIRAGSISYCQGFSEPGAGSDLAALRTRAEPTADGFLITGQKIWTSAASFADYCVLLARTGGERTAGISVFLVPMDTPGITVRRIPSLQGHRALHEVFLDAVAVRRDDLLGEKNGGWTVVRSILANERTGAPRYALTWRGFNRALEHLRTAGRFGGELVRARAARCEAALRAARLLALRVVDLRVKDQPLDAFASVARYGAALGERLVSEFLAEFAPDLLYPDADPVVWAAYRRSASYSIAAGTAEVQLDLIARAALDLARGR